MFVINTSPLGNYFLRTTSPEVTSTITQQLDTSVDNFWANTLHFPPDYQNNQYANDYANALQQIRLGIREGGLGCYNNKDLIHAAYYCSVADTIQWTQTHAINPTWLRYPLSTTLNALLEPSIEHLQRWNIPRATICPPNDAKKSDLPLSIPGPQLIQTWPKALFPTQGDFISRHNRRLCFSIKSVKLKEITCMRWEEHNYRCIDHLICGTIRLLNLSFGNVQLLYSH